MKKFSGIFLILLITLNVVASLRLSPIDASLLPSNSIRAQLTQMLIEVQQTESPKTIKLFIETIRDMASRLQREQDQHREINEKMMNQCVEEQTFREKEIADSNDAFSRSNIARAKCDSSLKSSQKDLPELEEAKKSYEDILAKAVEEREAEHARYVQRKSELEEAIAFLEDFIKYVNEKLKGSFKDFSFVQESEKILKHAAKLGLLAEAVPVLVQMSQIAASAGTEAHTEYAYTGRDDVANKLKNTLDSLLVRLKADWKTNEEIEISNVQVFTTIKEKLDSAITQLTENIEKTNKQIEAMTQCLKEEDAVIAKASAKLTRNTNLQKSAGGMCDSFAKGFINATNNRLEEITTINEILVIIEKRFGKLPQDIKDYLQSVEKGWKDYQNSTSFKNFIAYAQAHTAQNDQGKELVAEANQIA